MPRLADSDKNLEDVLAVLASVQNLAAIVGGALRQSFDEVIDGPRTGRYRIEQLEKTEKTYIGTKVEIVLRTELELARGRRLDNKIAGHEVDTKFSLVGKWMIPSEAVCGICLLVKGNDNSGTCSAGLLRMTEDVLTKKGNKDGKKSVSAAGKRKIIWLIRDAPIERNFLLDLNSATRNAVLSPSSGKQRIVALFRNVLGIVIPRSVVVQVAQLKGDPLRRARETKAQLAAEGIQVLCATYAPDAREFRRHGVIKFAKSDWLSIRKRKKI